MLQTVVIYFAVLVSLVLLGLLFWAAHQRQKTLQRLVRSAEAGGRPLGSGDRIAAETYGLLPRNVSEQSRHRLLIVFAIYYLVTLVVLASLFGPVLGIIATFLIGVVAVVFYALWNGRNGA